MSSRSGTPKLGQGFSEHQPPAASQVVEATTTSARVAGGAAAAWPHLPLRDDRAPLVRIVAHAVPPLLRGRLRDLLPARGIIDRRAIERMARVIVRVRGIEVGAG